MAFFEGKMPMYTGNLKGSFGTMKPSGGNVSKAPKGRGRKATGPAKGNAAKAPKRRGG